MGLVVIDLTMSLDGFIAGPDDGAAHPLGRGGEALFSWMSAGPAANQVDPRIRPPDASMAVVGEWMSQSGAIISGRRTFDIARGWRDGHPIDVPIFVLTRQPPLLGEWSPQVRFATSLDQALTRAQRAAGDRVVAISGAGVAQQLLRAGAVDEIQVTVAPLLLGGGVRLFDRLGPDPIELEQARVIASDGVTHLRYRVLNRRHYQPPPSRRQSAE
jgi:dihydrofolate reductase